MRGSVEGSAKHQRGGFIALRVAVLGMVCTFVGTDREKVCLEGLGRLSWGCACCEDKGEIGDNRGKGCGEGDVEGDQTHVLPWFYLTIIPRGIIPSDWWLSAEMADE